MALTGLDDPGLTVFPTHRLLSGFADDPERQRRLGDGLRELFEVERGRRPTSIDPAGEEGVGVFGLYDSHHKQRLPAAAQGHRRRSTAALEGKPEAYRRLDAAILETLVLKGLAGMSDDDIDAQARARLREERRRRAARCSTTATYDVAFILRPIPVEQVRAIADSRRETCRRSRPTSSPRC